MFAKSKLIITLVAVFILLMLTAAAPRSAMAAVEGCKQSHTVVSGDYLAKIAAVYGVNYMDIATLNQLKDPNRIYIGQVLCISRTTSIPVITTTPSTSTGTIKMYASAVVEDKTVTLTGKQLTPNSRYTVYLSNYKIDPAVQYLAGYVTTDSGGSFTKTFTIPKRLIDVALVRAVVVNSAGSSFTNWFINTTGTANIGGLSSSPVKVVVDTIKKDTSITITVTNLPANAQFKVYVHTGEKETGGILVGTVFAEKGGKVTKTFTLPSDFVGKANLNVRVENTALRMMAFKTFANK